MMNSLVMTGGVGMNPKNGTYSYCTATWIASNGGFMHTPPSPTEQCVTSTAHCGVMHGRPRSSSTIFVRAAAAGTVSEPSGTSDDSNVADPTRVPSIVARATDTRWVMYQPQSTTVDRNSRRTMVSSANSI